MNGFRFGNPGVSKNIDLKNLDNGTDIFYGTFSRSESDVDLEEVLDTISVNDFPELSNTVVASDVVSLYFLNVSMNLQTPGAAEGEIFVKFGSHNFINSSTLLGTMNVPAESDINITLNLGNFSASGQLFTDNGYEINQFSSDYGISLWSERNTNITDATLTIKGDLLLYTK